MKRREFFAVFGGAAVWPLAAGAQKTERRIGVLIGFPEKDPLAQGAVTALANGLRRLGWDEKNLRTDYRFAAGDPVLYETYATELVGLAPDAILASPMPAVLALGEQTKTIPIVFVLVPDPVGLDLVPSLARPGGNITGFASYDASMIGKWLELLKEIAPRTIHVALIFNPQTAFAPPLLSRGLDAAARSLGLTVKFAQVHDKDGIATAIAAEARAPGGGLICLPDSFNVTHRDAIIATATHYDLPLIGTPDFPRAGGLMSYSFDTVELYTQAASYIDRILKGASPADLPVQYPTKYSLIINLKTAKMLGLTVPSSLLELADQVIE
jgi:putative tryptophan/tyrosine transport system substrate-binding protein